MRLAVLLLAAVALTACSPLELAGEVAVGTVQLGLGAAQAAVGVVDKAI